MMKSPRSAIRLRLSRLIQVLLALCVLKLGLLGAAILDLPIPGLTSEKESPKKEILAQGPSESEVAKRLQAAMTAAGLEKNADSGKASEAASQTLALGEATPSTPDADAPSKPGAVSGKVRAQNPEPQGQEAAELASAARPASTSRQASPLPRPLLVAGPLSGLNHRGSSLGFENLALPNAPGESKPSQTPAPQSQTTFLDMLGLNTLPIPGLGSARVAQAASMDMPVPPTRPATSPFAPAEQSAGAQGQAGPSTELQALPPIPAQIPRGQNADGSPLTPRTGANPQAGNLPQLPGGNQNLPLAPAPQIKAQPSPVDPNAKAQELARQQQDMLMLRQQMDQRLKDLQNAEEKMKSMIREAKDLEDKKIRSLIQMYANMKPRMAAQAMENMDERVAVRILSGMAPKQSGEILTYTNPAKTAKFTELLTRMRIPE